MKRIAILSGLLLAVSASVSAKERPSLGLFVEKLQTHGSTGLTLNGGHLKYTDQATSSRSVMQGVNVSIPLIPNVSLMGEYGMYSYTNETAQNSLFLGSKGRGTGESVRAEVRITF